MIWFSLRDTLIHKESLYVKYHTVFWEPSSMHLFYRPAKQFISEEKMAAHLNGLHISSDYTSHSFASDDLMDVLPSVSAPSTSTLVSDKLKGHTIVLSEEIKRLQEEPLIPHSLMERYG